MKIVKDGKMVTYSEPSCSTAEQKIQRIEDLRSIEEILFHYTRCVDSQDFVGIASCYCDDGCFIGSDKSSPIKGKEAILAIFSKLIDPNIKTSAHYIANQQVHFESETEATVFAYFYSNKSFSNDREDEITCGGYELRVIKEQDNEWRIKTHKCFFTRQDGSKTGRFGENKNRPWPVNPEFSILNLN